jgi:hypothetical protein
MLTYFLAILIFIAILMFIKSRIRKASDAAFEREELETEIFYLIKPEGYLTPVDRQFEAYSRDYIVAGRLRKSWAKLNIYDEVRKNFQSESEEVDPESEVEILTYRKLIGDKERQKSYEIEASVVKEHKEEFIGKIGEMLNSFKLR